MLHRDFQLFSFQSPNSLVNSKQKSELLNAPNLHLRKCPVLLLPGVPWNSKVKRNVKYKYISIKAPVMKAASLQINYFKEKTEVAHCVC